MPTGYTAAIQEGCSFDEFALGCAKAFGPCITMKDEPQDKPIPDEFKPSDYHLKEQKETEAKLATLRQLTEKEADKCAEAEYLKEIDYITAQLVKTRAIQKQYSAMLEKVRAWIPPSAEHRPLKGFMVTQIQDSVKSDDMPEYYEKQQPVKLSGFVWKEKKCAEVAESLGRHVAEYAKECKRVTGRNQWVRQLRESLVN